MELEKCRIINFPQVNDARGNLSFIEERKNIPFELKRVYYLYDVPSGAKRGGHAHIALESVIIALSGSFDVKLDDGFNKKSFFLNRPHYGLFIPAGIWRGIENFSSNSIALVLASNLYVESDYIRNYRAFKKMVKNGLDKK